MNFFMVLFFEVKNLDKWQKMSRWRCHVIKDLWLCVQTCHCFIGDLQAFNLIWRKNINTIWSAQCHNLVGTVVQEKSSFLIFKFIFQYMLDYVIKEIKLCLFFSFSISQSGLWSKKLSYTITMVNVNIYDHYKFTWN